MIKAIETRYAGCHFRSRLEARWAVFFDALGIKWQYEPERFGFEQTPEEWHRSIQRSYLPDFYLPQSQTWIEVKGSDSALDWGLLSLLAEEGSPLPGMSRSFGSGEGRGLMVLGDIPYPTEGGWFHPLIQNYKGPMISHAFFTGMRDEFQIDGTTTSQIIDNDAVYTVPSEFYCQWDDWVGYGFVPKIVEGHSFYGKGMAPVGDAYELARSARFEHGQSGGSATQSRRRGHGSGWRT